MQDTDILRMKEIYAEVAEFLAKDDYKGLDAYIVKLIESSVPAQIAMAALMVTKLDKEKLTERERLIQYAEDQAKREGIPDHVAKFSLDIIR